MEHGLPRQELQETALGAYLCRTDTNLPRRVSSSTSLHVCMCELHMRTCIYACMCMCMCTYEYTDVYICICIHVYIYMYMRSCCCRMGQTCSLCCVHLVSRSSVLYHLYLLVRPLCLYSEFTYTNRYTHVTQRVQLECHYDIRSQMPYHIWF